MEKNKGNILIIDDDPLVLMNYADILEDAGYTPITASTSEQAWNILQSRGFDLIVCDHDLTDGKGIDLIKKMNAAGKDYPVIYLSAALPEILSEAASLQSVKKILTKPIGKETLIETLSQFRKNENGEITYPKLIGTEERRMLLNDTFMDSI
ncbi:MAG: hypothetical protein A2017_09720 [Lentisphaerae bacterium GWF2_44_16]|nr:MAG: hypothetical protein A2017_09720 [Lentisphaerae bacterium GWF2_44_16]